ncbi:MAG: DegV family EDD domain-containing protein [Lachnospiraceae bacterium]|nr:DegV family EDD domain-containing protein [Lachnospiraceae bacterium]
MKNVLNFIFKVRRKDAETLNTLKELYRSSMRTTLVVMVLMSLAELFFIIRTFIVPANYREYLWNYRCLYIALIMTLMSGYGLLGFIGKDYEKRYRILAIFNPVSAWLLYAWALGITYLDLLRGQVVDPTLFMTIILCVPLCLYINPLTFIISDVAANVIMLVMIRWAYSVAEYRAVSSFMNFLVFVIIQLTVGLAFLYTRYTLQDKILQSEMQQKENAELNASQSRFFSNMSHEIRTPINTIIGLNEMILREDISDEVADDARNIQSASTLLLNLVNDILDMSKIESGRMEVTKVSYNVGNLLSEIVGLLWIRAKEKGLKFHVEVDPKLPSLLNGDEVKIRQVLINVLTNAIKYTKEGSVTLSVHYEKTAEKMAMVTYTVSDTGIGIKRENIPYLFSAFKRVDEEKNRYIEGTGLGLSIVKQYVDLMGGEIRVNSIYGQGSSFVIDLPQKIENEKAVGELNFEVRHSMNARTQYKKKFEAPEARVLTVDDNEANLLVVSKLLSSTKVRMDTAISGEDALKKTLVTAYDLIFMDHMMPEMDGIECLHRIKEQVGGMSKEAKVIALTANAGSENQILYEKEGFDGYLLKPVKGEELENELMRQLPPILVHLFDAGMEEAEKIAAGELSSHNRIPIMITTDSVSDLPVSMIKGRNVGVLPYHVITSKGLFLDGVETGADGVLSYMLDSGDFARSEAPSVAEYEAFFAKQLTGASHIIHIAMAKRSSNGFDQATEASKSFDNVTVVDSGHLSSGMGLMVLAASRMVRQGMTRDEILSELDMLKTNIHTSFVVDSTDFLAKTGRVSRSVNRIANAFMMHPVIVLKDSKMTVGGVFFGTREHFWKRYIRKSLETVLPIDKRRLFITYAGMSASDLRKIAEEVRKKVEFDEVIFQKASPAISVNCGPGTFGLLFQVEG